MIGKVRVHIQGYLDHLSFMVAPIQGADVILDIPWHKQVSPHIHYNKYVLTLQHEGKDMSISAGVTRGSIPMVSHTQCSKVIKKGVNIFLIFIRLKEEQEENLGPLD